MRLSSYLLSVLLLLSVICFAGCRDAYEPPLPPKDKLNYPVGMAVHPSGDYLYVVNSNFQGTFKPDLGGTVSVVDLEDSTILEQHTPYLPSYGGQIQLNDNATKAYVSVRQGNAVAALDLNGGGKQLACERAGAEDEADTRECLIETVPGDPRSSDLPADPFGLDVTTVTNSAGESDSERRTDLVALSHLRGNKVSMISFPGQKFSSAGFVTAPIISGSNDVARRPGTFEYFVAGRRTNGVGVMSPFINDKGEVEALFDEGGVQLNHAPRPISVDARSLLFSDDGKRLYVLTRRPAALHVVSIVEYPDASPKYRLARTIQLAGGPSDIETVEGKNGNRLLYVSCYDEEVVQIVNPMTGVIVDEISFDSSPYRVVATPEQSDCGNDRCRTFVSLFDRPQSGRTKCRREAAGCGSVAVVDTNPDSDQYREVTKYID